MVLCKKLSNLPAGGKLNCVFMLILLAFLSLLVAAKLLMHFQVVCRENQSIINKGHSRLLFKTTNPTLF